MQIDKDTIIQNEVNNDGKTVFLYFDEMAGLYLAFGLSAYYTTLVTDPYISYSEELKMPVALLRREHILYLRQSMRKVEHQVKSYYRFELKTQVGKAGYDYWQKKIISAYERAYKKDACRKM